MKKENLLIASFFTLIVSSIVLLIGLFMGRMTGMQQTPEAVLGTILCTFIVCMLLFSDA